MLLRSISMGYTHFVFIIIVFCIVCDRALPYITEMYLKTELINAKLIIQLIETKCIIHLCFLI